jgi:hypothetical protein
MENTMPETPPTTQAEPSEPAVQSCIPLGNLPTQQQLSNASDYAVVAGKVAAEALGRKLSPSVIAAMQKYSQNPGVVPTEALTPSACPTSSTIPPATKSQQHR